MADGETFFKNTPTDPISKMTESAINLHVMFTKFVEGGFTEDQALSLIAKIMVESSKDES
jgi:hypothetical protein